MKAAQLTEYGGKNAITINEVVKPGISANQVLVQVKAAGVNPFDWHVREGNMQEFIKLTLPATLGGDVAGIVAEIGEDVTGFELGQKVYGSANSVGGHGSFAEFTPVRAEQLTFMPSSVDFNSAGALPLASVSALQALEEHIDLRKGQKILIHGGAGGIGSIAIQIAKHLGAVVTATSSSESVDYVKNLGADNIIDYKTQDFTTLDKDYDAVFDTVGGETAKQSLLVLKPNGVLVSMAARLSDEDLKESSVRFISQSTKISKDKLGRVAELVDSKVIKVNIDKVFDLSQAAEALEYLKISHPKGKVVLTV